MATTPVATSSSHSRVNSLCQYSHGSCLLTNNFSPCIFTVAWFLAFASDGWTGDISLDDVDFYEGKCRGSFMCDFENGLCTFAQSNMDTFDWTRAKGDTLSLGTGPQSDHTFGTGEGQYLQHRGIQCSETSWYRS